jgi:hypothetical protein
MVRVRDSNTKSRTAAQGLRLRASHTNHLLAVTGLGGVVGTEMVWMPLGSIFAENGLRHTNGSGIPVFLTKTPVGRYIFNLNPNPGKQAFITRSLIWSELRPPSPSDLRL